MANKGSSKHMKSLTTSRYYSVHRKERVYVAKPSAGRYTLGSSIPLVAFAVRAGLSESNHGASRMIKRKELLVNGIAVRDPAYPVGLSDVIESVPSKRSYEIGINERGQATIKEASSKGRERTCKIVQKYKSGRNTLMIRLHDGTVLKSGKDTNANDSVVIENNEIKRVLKLGNGCRCFVMDGIHVGTSGTVKEMHQGTAASRAYVTVEQGGGGSFDTLLRNIMVVE